MICTHSLWFLIQWDQGVLWHQQSHRPLLLKLNLLHLQICIYYTNLKVDDQIKQGFLRISEILMLPSFSPRNFKNFWGLPSKDLWSQTLLSFSKILKFREWELEFSCNEPSVAHPSLSTDCNFYFSMVVIKIIIYGCNIYSIFQKGRENDAQFLRVWKNEKWVSEFSV